MDAQRKPDLLLISMAFVSFVGLGLAAGLLGVAWLSIRAEYDLPLDAVGALLLANTLGYLGASFFSGQFAVRLGSGLMFMLGSVLSAAGLLGFVILPQWWMLIVTSFVASLGLGAIDAGMNNYVAGHHGARVMNWLHASFGVGVTIGPLIMKATLDNDLPWRWGYAVVFVAHVALALSFLLTLKKWPGALPKSDSPTPTRAASIPDTLRLPVVWLSIALFALYAGLEAVPGQWVHPLFSESRGIESSDAATWVSVYWGLFTVGRIFFGAIVGYVAPLRLLRWCMVSALAGAALLWWNPVNAVGFAGLMVLGFAQAPVFAILMSATSQRVAPEHAPNAVGFQMTGAGLGIAILPGLAGVLARSISLEIVPPFVLVSGILMIALHEYIVTRTLSPVAQPSGAD